MFSWPVGSKDEGAAPEIDSQIDPDITRYHPGYHPRISAQPMIPVPRDQPLSASSPSRRCFLSSACLPIAAIFRSRQLLNSLRHHLQSAPLLQRTTTRCLNSIEIP